MVGCVPRTGEARQVARTAGVRCRGCTGPRCSLLACGVSHSLHGHGVPSLVVSWALQVLSNVPDLQARSILSKDNQMWSRVRPRGPGIAGTQDTLRPRVTQPLKPWVAALSEAHMLSGRPRRGQAQVLEARASCGPSRSVLLPWCGGWACSRKDTKPSHLLLCPARGSEQGEAAFLPPVGGNSAHPIPVGGGSICCRAWGHAGDPMCPSKLKQSPRLGKGRGHSGHGHSAS